MKPILSETQERILDILKDVDATADEISDAISRSGISQRISELRRLGYSISTYDDGMGSLVYRINTEDDSGGLFQSSERQRMNNTIRSQIREMMDDIMSMRDDTPTMNFEGVDYDEDGETLCIVSSDWHIGKKVEDEYGNPVFNTDVAKQRLDNLNRNVYKLSSIINRETDIDEVVIIDVGDIVDGEQIYSTQYAHIDQFLPHQVDIAVKEKWKQIRTLRGKFNCPVRYLSVWGNHGGTGKVGISEMSNFDIMVQLVLHTVSDMHGDSGILIDNSYQEIATRKIRDNVLFMKHKAPLQTETAAARSTWGGWLAMYDWNLACCGHYHHYKINEFQGRPIFYNGSIVGPDDYSRRLAVTSKPSQLMFGVSDKHLPSFMYIVDVA